MIEKKLGTLSNVLLKYVHLMFIVRDTLREKCEVQIGFVRAHTLLIQLKTLLGIDRLFECSKFLFRSTAAIFS